MGGILGSDRWDCGGVGGTLGFLGGFGVGGRGLDFWGVGRVGICFCGPGGWIVVDGGVRVEFGSAEDRGGGAAPFGLEVGEEGVVLFDEGGGIAVGGRGWGSGVVVQVDEIAGFGRRLGWC